MRTDDEDRPEETRDEVDPNAGPAENEADEGEPRPDEFAALIELSAEVIQPVSAPSSEESPPEGEPSVVGRAPVGPTAPDWADSFTRLEDRLGQRLDAIQSVLERDSRAEATRERIVDRLHAELQEYKQDFLLKVQRPIFLDLIQLHDDVGKMIEARPRDDGDPDRAAAVRGILESIQVALEDILYRQGVEPFSVEGEAFDPRRQRAVSTVPTEDPARNKAVAVRLRKGFQSGERMIRPELVSVYTFRPPVSPSV
ncbi:MAG: nucleotide exchange factor GrpE [Isosphaeraceae bacterium]